MKEYKLNKAILLTNNACAELGLNNRIYQVGEIMEFPDAMAKAWLKNGTVVVYEPPAPLIVAPVKKAPKVAPKVADKSKEAK